MKSLINGSQNFALSFLLILATIFTAHAGEKITYIHNDALGSPVAATNQLGQVIWRETYKPHGQRTTNSAASANNKTWFTGKQEEAALGINYFGARWYHPEIGRFLVIDPAGVAPENMHSFNRYAYANNNPYANVDPDGREAACLYGGGCNINLTPSIVTNVASFIPVVGDALGVQQAIENPTTINIVSAGVGFIPGAGDAAGNLLKAGAKGADTLKPGAFARESIPGHPGRPTADEQRQVNELMAKNGCHTCGTKDPGTRSGNAIADHQPPQALGNPTIFLPHCNTCKARQGGQVVQEKRRRGSE